MDKLSVHNIGVAVRDIELVANFFIEKVGVKVELKLNTSPAFARVHMGSNYLYLFETTDKEVYSERAILMAKNPPGFDFLAILCDDVDEEYWNMLERGVEFYGEPCTYPEWHVRLVSFQDPEGNWYQLFQRIPDEHGVLQDIKFY